MIFVAFSLYNDEATFSWKFIVSVVSVIDVHWRCRRRTVSSIEYLWCHCLLWDPRYDYFDIPDVLTNRSAWVHQEKVAVLNKLLRTNILRTEPYSFVDLSNMPSTCQMKRYGSICSLANTAIVSKDVQHMWWSSHMRYHKWHHKDCSRTRNMTKYEQIWNRKNYWYQHPIHTVLCLSSDSYLELKLISFVKMRSDVIKHLW